jgi:phosphoribosylaminoimidazole (AIR) synthetase
LEDWKLHVISHSNKGLRLKGKEGDKKNLPLTATVMKDQWIEENFMIRSFVKGLGMDFSVKRGRKRKLQKLINDRSRCTEDF